MIVHQSPSKDCAFIFPILDDVDLLIDYNNLLWRVETSKIDSLSDFSDACVGFELKSFESNGNRFIIISKKEFGDSIELIFESRLQEEFPCAFFDQKRREYDDFSIPIEAQGFSLSTDTGDYMIVTSSDYDEDEEDDEEDINIYPEPDEEDGPDEPDEDINVYPEPANTPSPVPVIGSPDTDRQFEVLELQKQLNKCSDENDELRGTIRELETENSRLQAQLQSRPAAVTNDTDDAAKAELERLKTLISQLVDRDYNGDYIKTADTQIDDLTRKVEEVKKVEKEKSASLERLQKEYDKVQVKKQEIMDEISHTMDLLHKAESVQCESTTELSVFQKRLNDILSDLQIDIATLEMYETQDGIDALLLEANDMKSKIVSKLKALVSSRQKDAANRFNNITS